MSISRSSRAVLAALALQLALTLPALAVEDDLERRMLEVAAVLRCPVCQNLSVADSTSEMANDMRRLIADRLREGKTPEEIRAYFVSKYGQWILLSPDPRGIGLLVWVLPGLASVLALGGGALALRRWSRRPAAPLRVDDDALARVRTLVAGERPARDLEPDEARSVEALKELEFDHRAGKLSTGDYEDLRDQYERRAAGVIASADRIRREAVTRPATIEHPTAPAAERPRRRAWRWAAAALALFAFGLSSGVILSGAVRLRGDGSITGDLLTGTAQPAVASTRDVAALLAQGRQALAREDFRTAMTVFKRVLELDPDEPTANAYHGLLLHRGGHAGRALEAFERALRHDPASVPALWGKGLVLLEALQRPADAVQVWQRLLTLRLAEDDRTHVKALVAQAQARITKPAPAGRPR